MANLELPFGIKVLNPVPIDAKYLNEGIPYASTGQTNSLIPVGIRHTGLTVNVLGTEYWYKDGITDTDLVLKTTGGGTSNASGERIEKVINQANSFSIGEVIGFSGGTYVSALSSIDFDGEIHGIVTKTGTTDFTLTYAGYVTGLTSVLDVNSQPLSANTTYFLSDTVEGKMQNFQPSIVGSIIKPIFSTTINNAEGLVFQYLGVTVVTGITNTFITGGTNLGGGEEIFAGLDGVSMTYRTLVGSGDTIVENSGDIIIIYSSGGTGSNNVAVVSGIYSATTLNKYISSSGATTIYLPASPILGQEITISDMKGDAYTNNILIEGNGNLILDDTFGLINSDYGSVSLLWNGIIWIVTGYVA